MFFQSSAPGGHEDYFAELADLLRRTNGAAPEAEMIDLRRRNDIEQLTQLNPGQ